MEEYAKTTDCIADQPYDSIQTDGMLGCGSPIAYIYFISFMLLISMMMMNLFVAVVIEGYAESVGCLLSPSRPKRTQALSPARTTMNCSSCGRSTTPKPPAGSSPEIWCFCSTN